MVFGFFKHTPFLASEVLARVVILGISLLASLGWRQMRTLGSGISLALATAREQAEEFGYAS
jgi:hypothetical protein